MDLCFPHDGLSNGKNNSIMGEMLIMGLYYLHYGLMFVPRPTMACLKGKIIPLWDKYFEIGIWKC